MDSDERGVRNGSPIRRPPLVPYAAASADRGNAEVRKCDGRGQDMVAFSPRLPLKFPRSEFRVQKRSAFRLVECFEAVDHAHARDGDGGRDAGDDSECCRNKKTEAENFWGYFKEREHTAGESRDTYVVI